MIRIASLVLTAGLLIPPVSLGASTEGAYRADLGNQGELYRVRQARLEGDSTDHWGQEDGRPALVLDIIRSNGPTESLVVPTTESSDPEFSPYTLFEERSETLYVVWESRLSGIYSQVRLVWLQNDQWSEVIEISGNPYTTRGAPRFTITKDSYLDDNEVVHERTVLHLVWWEDTHTGGDVLYTPVVLVDGVYVGHQRPSSLSELVAPGPGERSSGGGVFAEGAEDLVKSPSVSRGRREGEILGVFGDAGSGRLLTFRLSLVPVELARIAEDLRAHMIEIGHNLDDPREPSRLADRARAHMIEIGHRLGIPVRNALAESVHQFTLEETKQEDFDFGEEDLEALGDGLRAHMIEIGLTLQQDGVSPIRRKSEQAFSHVADLDPFGRSVEMGSVPQFIALEAVESFEMPVTAPEEKELHISEDGRNILISWSAEDAVQYRETGPDGWSERHQIQLEGQMSAARARQLLTRRIAQR